MIRAALVAAALWTGAANASDWTGIWAADPDWCQYVDQIGYGDPSPIQLTASDSIGLENRCAIRATAQVGDLQAWHQRLSCSAEGTEYEDERLMILAGPDELWISTAVAGPIRFSRCPE